MNELEKAQLEEIIRKREIDYYGGMMIICFYIMFLSLGIVAMITD